MKTGVYKLTKIMTTYHSKQIKFIMHEFNHCGIPFYLEDTFVSENLMNYRMFPYYRTVVGHSCIEWENGIEKETLRYVCPKPNMPFHGTEHVHKTLRRILFIYNGL